jgi:peptidoglycan/xylan/chitin deacetylase (PgdA/CDA1 family)
MYHSVGDTTAAFTVSASMFEKQLAYLKAKKYEVVLLSELVRRLEKKESIANTVVLTFDDGYADNYEIAFPLLKKYSLPASIFLTTGNVGTVSENTVDAHLPYLTKNQILEMKKNELIEFFPHGHFHKKLHALTAEDARNEIMDSFRYIENLLGAPEKIFAYASGKYSNETIKILTEEKFKAAVTVKPGSVTVESVMLELPRNHVDSATSMAEFKARLTEAGEWYEAIKKGTKVL